MLATDLARDNPRIETRVVSSLTAIKLDIARDLYQNTSPAPSLVVAANPHIANSVIRRHWVKMRYMLECQRVSTIDRHVRSELDAQARRMDAITFSTKITGGSGIDVYVLEPAEAALLAELCARIYFDAPFQEVDARNLLPMARPGAVLMCYRVRLDVSRRYSAWG